MRKYRGPKNNVNSRLPYAFFSEHEHMHTGEVEEVATIFLTNKECPFTCLMCDLWKNTTDRCVAVGDIPAQIEYALRRLPTTKHIKLYNSGNFFDPQAIPPKDHPVIIDMLKGFKTVIVENHPRLTDHKVVAFRDALKTDLQVAIGLETSNPAILALLNKRMTTEDFQKAVRYLASHDILARAFILLRPPFVTEQEGIADAKASLRFAFDAGVECCAVIPTRKGNGVLDKLATEGHFHSPMLTALEEVFDYGASLNKGRVFADLWDLKQFSSCSHCITQRKKRLHQMNLSQKVLPAIRCACIED